MSSSLSNQSTAVVLPTTEMLRAVDVVRGHATVVEMVHFKDYSTPSMPPMFRTIHKSLNTVTNIVSELEVIHANRPKPSDGGPSSSITSRNNPDQAVFRCVKDHCTFETAICAKLAKHIAQKHELGSEDDGELMSNDDDNADGSLEVSTQPPPLSPSSSSPSPSSANANVQNGDHHDGTEAANQGERSFNDQLSHNESTVNNPGPRVANHPASKGKGNGTVPVGGMRGCVGQDGPSGSGGSGPEMDNKVVAPLRIQVDEELNLDLDDQNRDDAGVDDVHVAENDQEPLDGNAAAAVVDQEAPVPDDDDDDDDNDEEQEVAPRPTRDPKKVERVKFQLVSPKKAKNYYPRYKKTKPQPKLVLNRSDPLFNVIMAALRQSEASQENPAKELSRVLSNGRFQQLTIGFSTRRTRRAVP